MAALDSPLLIDRHGFQDTIDPEAGRLPLRVALTLNRPMVFHTGRRTGGVKIVGPLRRISSLTRSGKTCRLALAAASLWVFGSAGAASAREFTSQVEELDHIPAVRSDYPVPTDANLLFYVQRSANANTVVYVARPDRPGQPVQAYWRLFKDGGGTRELNFPERLFAYGVSDVQRGGPDVRFHIRALPELELTLAPNPNGRPAAWTHFGDRPVRLVYVYLQVDNRGLTPSVFWLDLFGLDQRTGKPLREHLIPR